MTAIDVLRSHPDWGPPIAAQHLLPYAPMPPLLEDATGHRVVTVGLHAPDAGPDSPVHQLVGVDLENHDPVAQQTLHEPVDEDCPAPLAHNECAYAGRTGQAEIVVTQDGIELWRLVVVRPRESSGTNGRASNSATCGTGAAASCTAVDYGTLVRGRCGPTYRDWLDQETCFETVGTDVTSGIRMCDEEPRTIMRSGSDSGNFVDAVVYLDDTDLVITSELSAGWYRYITEWKLHDDGNITPRSGFSAVRNVHVPPPHPPRLLALRLGDRRARRPPRAGAQQLFDAHLPGGVEHAAVRGQP